MKHLRLVLTVIITVASVSQVFSAVKIAAASGRWEQAATWTGGVLPGCGDSIVIGSGKTVEISTVLDFAACSQAMKLNITGVLTFQTGKKLKLPCSSFIKINSGGSITGGGGEGSSNLIDICNTTVWTTSMGNLSGPYTLQLNPLPAQLVDFSATNEGSIIVLNWVTSSELNNDYFTVEKSRNGVDFEELGQFDGAGTSTNINSYKVYDIIPFEGTQFYRLRQTDFDGKNSTSRTIGIKWSKGVECNIYPNPTKGELFANLDPKITGQSGQLLVNNTDGKLLLSKEIQIQNSGYGLKLLQSNELLKPGSYLVTLNFKGKVYTQYIVSR